MSDILILNITDPSTINANLNLQPKHGVQRNINHIHKTYGTNFHITYNTTTIPVTLEQITTPVATYFTIRSNLENRQTYMYPFRIDLIDPDTNELNNTTYIPNIHKTDKITGTQMVELVLQINKILGATKTYLHDGTEVSCSSYIRDLSLIKLIDKGLTFYMKFGFQLTLNRCQRYDDIITDEIQMTTILNSTLQKIRSIKITTLIDECIKIINLFTSSITKNYLPTILLCTSPSIVPKNQRNIYYKEVHGSVIQQYLNNTTYTLHLLRASSDTLLYKYLSYLFNDPTKCYEYEHLINALVYTNDYIIKGENTQIIKKYPFWFRTIIRVRNFRYVYYFERT